MDVKCFAIVSAPSQRIGKAAALKLAQKRRTLWNVVSF